MQHGKKFKWSHMDAVWNQMEQVDARSEAHTQLNRTMCSGDNVKLDGKYYSSLVELQLLEKRPETTRLETTSNFNKI